MRRRDFIALLRGDGRVSPAARAQQPALPLIGLILARTRELFASRLNLPTGSCVDGPCRRQERHN